VLCQTTADLAERQPVKSQMQSRPVYIQSPVNSWIRDISMSRGGLQWDGGTKHRQTRDSSEQRQPKSSG
jgi:hypothetical protein